MFVCLFVRLFVCVCDLFVCVVVVRLVCCLFGCVFV